MKEIWKDIKNYEGLYKASNFGKIKSIKKGILLKPFTNTRGYLQVDLYKCGKHKHFLVHRIIAETFLENKNNLEEVNHKDENKLNNNINNLEWCTSKYNCNYGTRNLKKYKPVLCVELNKRYESIKKASEELKIQQAHISGCCKNKKHYNTAGGYHWQYAKEGLYVH